MLNSELYEKFWENGYIVCKDPSNLKFNLYKIATSINELSYFLQFENYEEAISRIKIEMNVQEDFNFSVIALYNKGLGPEFFNLEKVSAKTIEEAQEIAEEKATVYFYKKFGKKYTWEEVRIRKM